mmetsp:Transcript_3104/g.7950  ORF Transcript_3104/g.7950 Transcript_3104/m.7950 type:complete len:242 (-) Transcript_3104:69-794(-)
MPASQTVPSGPTSKLRGRIEPLTLRSCCCCTGGFLIPLAMSCCSTSFEAISISRFRFASSASFSRFSSSSLNLAWLWANCWAKRRSSSLIPSCGCAPPPPPKQAAPWPAPNPLLPPKPPPPGLALKPPPPKPLKLPGPPPLRLALKPPPPKPPPNPPPRLALPTNPSADALKEGEGVCVAGQACGGGGGSADGARVAAVATETALGARGAAGIPAVACSFLLHAPNKSARVAIYYIGRGAC